MKNQVQTRSGCGEPAENHKCSAEETAAVRELLEDRRTGRFISLAEGRKRTARMIARKRAAHGLSGGTAEADA